MTKPLRVTEFAEEVGVHPETVRRGIARGEIEAYRLGRLWLIPRSALSRWVESEDEKDGGTGIGVPTPQGRPLGGGGIDRPAADAIDKAIGG